MSTFINTIDALGEDVVADSMILRTITEFKDDVVKKIGACAFRNCKSLTLVDTPNVTTIVGDNWEANAFQTCSALKCLILRNEETICTLSHTKALNGSKIASGTGYIYVPSALVDSYKAATNWSTYANQFRALEDYTVDGTVTGELDETKI